MSQLVASGSVQYVSVADIPEEVRRREAEIEAAKEDLASKPEAIRLVLECKGEHQMPSANCI